MSEQKKLSEALFKVQQNLESVKKKATNPHFKSKFADLNEVLSVCKSALNAEGLTVLQPTGKDSLATMWRQ